MRPRVGVVTFPGSNDDGDALRAIGFLGGDPVSIWHGDSTLGDVDAVVLPGGFSYGDYLRTGAIARFAPVMGAVLDFAERGGPVLGVCNGFQILCEAGMLPGALIRNRTLSFVCRWINVRVEGWPGSVANEPSRGQTDAEWSSPAGEVLQMPIKHGEGQFVASPEDLATIEDEGQVVLRYCSPDGGLDPGYNPNGSTNAIAGIRNAAGNVLGLMPHPEHAVDPDLGPTGGQQVLQWLLEAARVRVSA